jgi:lipoprotein signal peptidase
VFNVADCFVVVCTLLLFLLFMFVYKEEDLEFLQTKKGRLTKQDKEKDKE